MKSDSRVLFEGLMRANGEEYERLRLELFSNPDAVSEIKSHLDGVDPVDNFVARTLYGWSMLRPPEYAEAERYISESIPAWIKENKTASGGSWTNYLLGFLAVKKEEGRDVGIYEDYLLLKVLKHPELDGTVYAALLSYYKRAPVPEPELWIRKALSTNDDVVLNSVAEKSLRKVERSRLLRALNYERARQLRRGDKFPDALEKLRSELMGRR